ncbi:MAG: ABC transporter permease [Lachnospiraceae bacterium]|nr:ABC transporter permease [Lachnospiraceae bacterium]
MEKKKKPYLSIVILAIILLSSMFAGLLTPYAPGEMDDAAFALAPCKAHIFGTDTMGRDLYTLVLYGGRASLIIGMLSALIATFIASVYGTLSGIAPKKIDHLLMRITDVLISVPGIIMVIFLQAICGKATYLSLSLIIGATGWMSMSKVVRSEVRRIRNSDFILSAKLMGGGFWYILLRHLFPTFFPSIMFMAVSSIGSAMITESTLSFMGLGLPLTEVSWGSLLSMSQNALLSNQWWLIVIPGLVLVVTLVFLTELGEYLRGNNTRLHSNI